MMPLHELEEVPLDDDDDGSLVAGSAHLPLVEADAAPPQLRASLRAPPPTSPPMLARDLVVAEPGHVLASATSAPPDVAEAPCEPSEGPDDTEEGSDEDGSVFGFFRSLGTNIEARTGIGHKVAALGSNIEERTGLGSRVLDAVETLDERFGISLALEDISRDVEAAGSEIGSYIEAAPAKAVETIAATREAVATTRVKAAETLAATREVAAETWSTATTSSVYQSSVETLALARRKALEQLGASSDDVNPLLEDDEK